MASGQKARREDLKKEQEKRSGIEDTARGQVNTYLGQLGPANQQNRDIYLQSLNRAYAPGAAESSIGSSLGGYYGGTAPTQPPSAPVFRVPQTPAVSAPKFFRYSDDNQAVYRSDGSHVENPDQFFAEGGNRDWSGISTVDRPSDGVLPWMRQAEAPAVNIDTPAPKVETGGGQTAPPAYDLSGERGRLLTGYFDPNSPTFGQTPGAYLPTGQVARRRQLREATNRGATTWSRNVMNPSLRGLADEQADRESAQDEAFAVSGARAGYDQGMRGELSNYDREMQGTRESAANREQQRNLAALGITSGMAGQSQGLLGGLLSDNLNNASGGYFNSAGMYDQARAQQGQGWAQAAQLGIGLGTSLLGGYLAGPAAAATKVPKPVAPMSITSGNPYYYR